MPVVTSANLVMKRGYITQAKYLRSQSSAELERRLGFRAGRLSQGWTLYFLTKKPTAEQFEFRGYTQMSDGVGQGHLTNPPDRRNAEARLRDDGYDIPRMKARIIAETFAIRGVDRLAKVIPVRDAFGEADFPPGSGIPQWELTKPVEMVIAAEVGPGETYQGNYD